MGFLDFLKYRKKTHEENIEGIDFNPPIINEKNPFNPIGHDGDVDHSSRVYSDKGITFRENNKANPWQSYFSITKKIDGKHKTIQFHIGYFPTKEEAQKARWEFIENLK